MSTNYVDFYRFCNRTEDVFIEDDHYLYASAEPFDWAYMMACRPYYGSDGAFILGDYVGADVQYLSSLVPADETTAAQIILFEAKEYLRHCEDMDEEEKEDYLSFKENELGFEEDF